MVANHVGYEVGTFAHFVQNLHVYDRHFNAVDELLEREPLLDKTPSFGLKPEAKGKNFYDITNDDFWFKDIDDIPNIVSELEIAV